MLMGGELGGAMAASRWRDVIFCIGEYDKILSARAVQRCLSMQMIGGRVWWRVGQKEALNTTHICDTMFTCVPRSAIVRKRAKCYART